jgi:hypothetical protein
MYQTFMMIGDRLVARYNVSRPVGDATTPSQPAKSGKASASKRQGASK